MQGHLDSVLTPSATEQAAAAAPVLAALGPDRVVSSDLQPRGRHGRAWSAPACGLPVKFDARLRETHLGDWQGRTVAEIDRDYPGAIATWRSDPGWAPPGGESRVAVVARSRPVVDELDAEFADSDGIVDGVAGRPRRVDRRAGHRPHGAAHRGLAVVRGLGNCRWAVLARREDHPRWRLAGYNVGV